MKKKPIVCTCTCFSFLFFLLTVYCIVPTVLYAQAPDTLWTKTYGGTGDDYGYSVQQTSDGGYIIAGWTESFGAGQSDVYLIKTDSFGDTLWTKTYGGSENDEGYSVQQTTDGGYIIVGSTHSFGAGGYYDVYLIKSDSMGDTIWTMTYGGISADYGYSVQQTTDSGYIIVGWTNSFGVLGPDVYLLKTDSLGDTLWTKTYGGYESDVGRSVKQTPDGGYIIAGQSFSFSGFFPNLYLIKTDSLGDTVWWRTYGVLHGYDAGYSIQLTPDGGYIVAGYTDSIGYPYHDVYLIKTNSLGNALWARAYGGSDEDIGYTVSLTADDGYIIAGETESFGAGEEDVYFLKIDSMGDTIWTMTYGGTDDDYGYSVQQTSDSSYIIAGTTRSFGAGGEDVYLIKTEPDQGINEHQTASVNNRQITATIFQGPLQLPEGKKYKVFDITGRLVIPETIKPGVYFIEIDGVVTQKVIKIE
jgi:hypothetical protein